MWSSAAETFVLESFVVLLHFHRLDQASGKILLLTYLCSVSSENLVLSSVPCFFFSKEKLICNQLNLLLQKNMEYDHNRNTDNLRYPQNSVKS